MTNFVFANNALTTLGAALTSGATSATLALGTGALFPSIPSGAVFSGSLEDAATKTVSEIVYVTAISGDTVTIARAQEGTIAHSWIVGDLFSLNLTAAAIGQFLTAGHFSPPVVTSATTTTSAGSTTSVSSPAFVAPVAGTLVAQASCQPVSGLGNNPVTCQLSNSLNSSTYGHDAVGLFLGNMTVAVAAGNSVVFSLSTLVGSSPSLGLGALCTQFTVTFWPSV